MGSVQARSLENHTSMHTLLRIPAPRNARLVRTIAPAAVCLLAAPRTSSSSPSLITLELARWSSSSSTWKERRKNDHFARQARVNDLKGRAAFKLIDLDSRYKLFKPGQVVIDLGYAPGSWSQVAVQATKPHGRVVGIDLIPAQPPKGVSTIQGNFLSPSVQDLVKQYLMEFVKPKGKDPLLDNSSGQISERPSYIDTERAESMEDHKAHMHTEKIVDIVLSDMSAPWELVSGNSIRTISNPYYKSRMMNTSGNGTRDHAGSMDLCLAALKFASDTLRPGGHFVCKFYQGAEDKDLETRLSAMFAKVHRDKPEASKKQSREAYFVALRRKADKVFADNT